MKKIILTCVLLMVIPFVVADNVSRIFVYKNPADFPNTIYRGDTISVNYTRSPSNGNIWAVEEYMPSSWSSNEQSPINNKLKFWTQDNKKNYNFISPLASGSYLFNDGRYWTYGNDNIYNLPTEIISVTTCTPSTEVCDGTDNDCDYQIDEGVKNNYYRDLDSDSYGNSASTTQACTVPVGYVADSSDCNDANANVNPGKAEVCNGVDDNCATGIDEGGVCSTTNYYCDSDSDSYISAIPSGSCSTFNCVPTGCLTTQGNDCNDGSANVNPGKAEVCNGVDDNCNSQIDEGVKNNYYRDLDSDSYGNSASTTQACTVPVGYVADSSDCNDANANVNPGKAEVCNGVDDNCNGLGDEPYNNYYRDADSDSYGDSTNIILDCSKPAGYINNNLDCNDANANVNPGKAEVCDGVDDNCATGIDEGGVCSTTNYYCDSDSDSYISAIPSGSCSTFNCVPTGCLTTQGNDCNDGSANVNPGKAEVCNGVDDNCNSQIDEGVKNNYYRDLDSDSYGNSASTTQACTVPVGYVADSSDCNDANANVNPGKAEVCNGVDDNCNGLGDEPYNNYYFDSDVDSYGGAQTQKACTQPANHVTNSNDCNDNNINIHPGAIEVCNGVDDNCATGIDEGGVCSTTNYYCDSDSDSYISAIPSGSCSTFNCVPTGCLTTQGNDCNDGSANVNPGKAEVCNGVDDNCNSQIDEGVKNNYYRDLDSDSYGNSASTTQACTVPVGYVADSSDCNDANANVNPGKAEVCNGVDDNCNGLGDEPYNNYYFDSDVDSYGGAQTQKACTQPANHVTNSNDCNDNNINIHPGAIEVCNGVDDNCATGIDEGGVCSTTNYYCDSDSDSYISAIPSGSCSTFNCVPTGCLTTQGNDCNDGSANVNPGKAEVCNGVDDNCNSQIDEGVKNNYYRDLDSDSYGNSASTTQACTVPVGYVADSSDCNDANANVNPGKAEVCNGVDDNCNLIIDEGKNTEADTNCNSCIDPAEFIEYANKWVRDETTFENFIIVVNKWVTLEGCVG